MKQLIQLKKVGDTDIIKLKNQTKQNKQESKVCSHKKNFCIE